MVNSSPSSSENLPNLPYTEYREPEPWPEIPREAWPSPSLQIVVAKHLLDTLDLLGSYHMLTGLESATDPESLHRAGIVARFDDEHDYERFLMNAEGKLIISRDMAYNEFARAFGLISLEAFGIVRESEESDRFLPDIFSMFDSRYFGPDKEFKRRRDQLRTELEKKMYPPPRSRSD
jgi:hypothetical protein